MPKLIKIDTALAKEITHPKCGAVISYFDNEKIKAIHEDYGGGSEIWYYIICPNPECGQKIEVK